MADSFLRRLYILQMLKRKEDGVITIPEIINRLQAMGFDEIKNKTIERDMSDLSTKISITCDDTKRPFLWWYDGKYEISIPSMSRHSALTLKLAQQYLTPLLPTECLLQLQSKLLSSKKDVTWKNAEKELHWMSKIRVVPKGLNQQAAKVSNKIHTAVYDALYEEKMLNITYHSRGKDEVSQRSIHPLALIYRGITTELIFCDEGSSTVKRFILNRIVKATVQVQSLNVPDGFNLDNYLETQLGFPGSCEEIQFKAWLSQYARANVEETPISKNQKIEEVDDGGIILTATIRETADLTTWILGLGPKIKVLEPDFLREEIAGRIKSMCEMYFD